MRCGRIYTNFETVPPADRIMACLCKVEDERYLIEKLVETMEGMEEEQRKDYIMKLLTLTELRPNLRIKLTEEVKPMPIVVRPEDIRLPKRKLRKDILYRLGLEEGKQIGLEEGKKVGLEEGKKEGEVIGIEKGRKEGEVIGIEKGLLKSAQDMVIAVVEVKLGYVPEGLEEKVREIKDRDFLHALIKKLITSEKVLEVLKEELNI